MKKILYYVSEHGLGHLTRSIGLIRELENESQIMIRNSNEQEVENMSTAIDLFTHIKIHLFKNSSIYNGEISSPFNKENFSYTITSSGMSDD